MKTELYYHNKQLVAVIYETDDGKIIAAEKYSSMGFKSKESAQLWLSNVCKAEPFTPENGCYKMMPDSVKSEIPQQY